ncbi:molybdenum cofactor carrier [Rhodoferax lacus]|uniref:Molybdenum cofactor carrier n=2 Tax=Rhodoferax lacus TaxID=2184758 RepID=A0A3E1RGX4_9BURK|nr:molybdenum cofactor carrier [Rhodoferax lacus]
MMSGGQTGVDRAALDFAIESKLPHAGWCPRGRIAIDGVLPARYQLRETESDGYRQRTRLNVQDSQATLLLNVGALDGGTLQTLKFTQTMVRPCLVVQMDIADIANAAIDIQRWLEPHQIKTLNIAGPREEKRPGIYAMTFLLLRHLRELPPNRNLWT